MIKRLPSRNSRSKGIKLKHILQICLLLGICFWLVYQVKHSHDKKKEFDENDVTTSIRKMSEDEILRLGRKDLLHPHEDSAKSEKHVEEEEEETPAEEEEKHAEEERGDEGNKHEEDEREDEINKHEEEEREDEGNKHEVEEQDEEEEEENKDEDVEDGERGGGDDEIDENDQERKEHEGDRDEEFIDEEKELEEEGDEKKGKTNEKEGKETQVENKNSSEHQDNDDGSQVSHEAREEHYKGDDASSAVTHDVRDSQVISTEPEKVNSENSEFNGLQKEHKTNTTEGDTRIENTSVVSMVGEGEISRNGTYLNVSGVEQVDSSSSITENSQALVLSNNQTEARNNSTMGSTETGNTETSTKVSDSSLPTGVGSVPHSNNAQNATVDGATTVEGMKVETSFLEHTNNSNIASYGNQSDFNSPFSTDFEHQNATLGKSLDATDSNVAGKSLKLNGTAEAEDNHTSATTKVDADASRNDKSNSELESNRTRKISDSINGTNDATQHDPVDSSVMHVTEAEKEIQIDTNALPDIKTEGDENEEAAAE